MRGHEKTVTEVEAFVEGKSCITVEGLYRGLGVDMKYVTRPLRILVADVMKHRGWEYRMHSPSAGEPQRSMWVNTNQLGVVDYRTVEGVYKTDEQIRDMVLSTAEDMVQVHVDELIKRCGFDNPNTTVRRRITRLLKDNGWAYQTVRLDEGKFGKRWVNNGLMVDVTRLRKLSNNK